MTFHFNVAWHTATPKFLSSVELYTAQRTPTTVLSSYELEELGSEDIKMPPRIRLRRLLPEGAQLIPSWTSIQVARQCPRQLSSLANPSRNAARLLSPPLSVRQSIPRTLRRTFITVPGLVEENAKLQNGIEPLYGPAQFAIVWKEYQTHLIDQLNIKVAGSDLQDKNPLEIAIQTSRNAHQASIFNYASAAHNNQFFIESLSPTPITPAPEFIQMVGEGFTSFEQFKQSFIATALACFSNAYIWLVVDEGKTLKILTTYNSGTPYGAAHRRQSVDTNTADPIPAAPADSEFVARLQDLSAPPRDKETRYIPLLCVNVWQHAWVPFYGFDGKEAYLENWWSCIDWALVYGRFNAEKFEAKSNRKMFNAVRNDGGGANRGESITRGVLERQAR